MRAIVLVGGEGTRLRPLTLHTLKQLVPILNRPLLEPLLLHLRSHGIIDVTLAMTRHSERVQEVFGDGNALGMHLDYVYEETPLVSGGAIAAAAAGWQQPFLVCNGDLLTDLDIGGFVAAHHARRALLSIALYEVEDPSPFGVVVLGAHDRIVRFIEKPPRRSAPSRLINAGTWLFDPSLLREMDATHFNRVEDGLFPDLASAGRAMCGFEHAGYWRDVGNPDVYLRANLELLMGALPARLPDGWPANGMGTAAATVSPSAAISAPVLLGAGTNVQASTDIVGPVITGANCRIEHGVHVTNSVLWDDVIIDADARISGSVLANGVRVGAAAVIRDTVIGRGASIAPGTVVPPGTRVAPDAQWVSATEHVARS